LDVESADFTIWDEEQTEVFARSETVMVEADEEEEMAVDETMAAATPSMQESIQFFEEAFAAEEQDHEQVGLPIDAAPRQQRSLQSVEEWVPSHVRQGLTARMQAEAEARLASGLPAFPAPAAPISRSRAIEPQEDARDQAPRDPAPRRSSLPVRTHVFESWRREQERRNTEARPQQEDTEAIATVEEPEPAPAPTPAPAPRSASRAAASAAPMDLPDTMAKAPKPASRLAFLSRGRSSREPAPAPEPASAPSHHESTPAHAEQETFDQTLRPAPAARGRFDKAEPTIEDGEDLDVPTFMRRQP
jgi:hypothetical protein